MSTNKYQKKIALNFAMRKSKKLGWFVSSPENPFQYLWPDGKIHQGMSTTEKPGVFVGYFPTEVKANLARQAYLDNVY